MSHVLTCIIDRVIAGLKSMPIICVTEALLWECLGVGFQVTPNFIMVILQRFMSGIYVTEVNKLQHQQKFIFFVFEFNDNNFFCDFCSMIFVSSFCSTILL
jgi:hypothetical protein